MEPGSILEIATELSGRFSVQWIHTGSAWMGGDLDAAYNLATTLEDCGETEEAARVYRLLFEQNYVKSVISHAWILKDEHQDIAADEVLVSVLGQPGLVGTLVAGTLGHWRWSDGARDVESLLRKGADVYPAARADLAVLLLHRGGGPRLDRHWRRDPLTGRWPAWCR